MNLSGGPFTYNRFDMYEKKLDPVGKEDKDIDNDGDVDSSDSYLSNRRKAIGLAIGKGKKKVKPPNKVTGVYEGKGASNPEEMEKEVRKASKKAKARGGKLEKEDEKEEAKQEKDTADVSEDYQAPPSPPAEIRKATGQAAGNRMADIAMIGAAVGAGKKKGDKKGKLKKNSAPPVKPTFESTVTPGADMAQRKLNKDANNSKLKVTKAVMEQEQRMAMYSRALGVMGAHYSGPQVETQEEETVQEASKPDYLDFDKDGDKKEPMKKALKEKGMKKEEVEVELTKEDVIEYMVAEGYATNEVSAEILHTHISDDFLAEIEDRMISEMGPAYPSETKAQAKAQSDHREGKSSAGLKTGKNPGLKASHTSGANKQA